MRDDVRDSAAKLGVAVEEALERGLEEKSAELLWGGGEPYRNV